MERVNWKDVINSLVRGNNWISPHNTMWCQSNYMSEQLYTVMCEKVTSIVFIFQYGDALNNDNSFILVNNMGK